MKLSTILLSALLGFSTAFAQIPGMMSTQVSSAPEGTALGANETLTAAGIALGNRVKMRGYVDFMYSYVDNDVTDTAEFLTSSDVDFLFDLSPVTAELHLNIDDSANLMEQAFGRYSFNSDFHLTFGRQLTSLGYEADEAPGLYAVSNAYSVSPGGIALRRNYVDGVKLNFNNGQFGFILGLHDAYWGVQDNFNDHVAIDLAASVMIVPGLEARLGYAFEDHDDPAGVDNDIRQINAWIAYNPNDLTLALEFDSFAFYGDDLWSLMLLANYQFTDWFAATLRYSHEDLDQGGSESDADRFTLALLFTITQNLGLNVEYSHASVEVGSTDYDVNEFYIEGLVSF